MGDTRHVEEIVDQASHAPDVAFDRLAHFDRFGRLRAHHAQNFHAVAQRRERVSQLMSERGKEVALRLVCRGQVVHQPPPLRDVAIDLEDRLHLAAGPSLHDLPAFDDDLGAVSSLMGDLTLPALVRADGRNGQDTIRRAQVALVLPCAEEGGIGGVRLP